MTGYVSLSFDCEGKWGMSDQSPESLNFITSPKLFYVYKKILKLLKKHQFPATFGFVSAFCFHKDELVAKLSELQYPITYNKKDWLLNVKNDIDRNDFSGWSEPEIFDMVKDVDQHYICTHGGLHIPYCEKNTPIEVIEEDLKLIQYFNQSRDILTDCLIYPRNHVGYKKLIYNNGIKYYRDIDKYEEKVGFRGKLIRFSNEFISNDFLSQSLINSKNMDDRVATPLSCSKFMNAKIGLRKNIPNKFTKERFYHAILNASSTKKVAHFYTHPHNFISDPTMFDKLDFFLRTAKQFENKNKIRIVTMKNETLFLKEISNNFSK